MAESRESILNATQLGNIMKNHQLRNKMKRSPLQGIMETGHVFGYVPMKKKTHWSWKFSEVFNKHKLYRHQNVPHNGTPDATYFLPLASIRRVGEVTGKHVLKQEQHNHQSNFYARNWRKRGGR